MTTFHWFFSVQGTGSSPTGPNPENRLGDPGIGSPRPFSSSLQVLGESGYCRTYEYYLPISLKSVHRNIFAFDVWLPCIVVQCG